MGHERVGTLPRTREWRRLVSSIAAAVESPEKTAAIATATLLGVRQRLEGIPSDPGFRAAFRFIIALVTRDHGEKASEVGEYPQIDLGSNPSAVRLTGQLRTWVDKHAASLEYAELSKRAGADVIAFWTATHAKQSEIFSESESATQIWRDATTAGAFSDVCRTFFGRFTARYLKYFLLREASAQLGTAEARDSFERRLDQHLGDISRHAFESTKINQSFAAGWYNAHARRGRPTEIELHRFLGFSMAKLREELLRESAKQ